MLMVAETLALRKELGSGSDETGSARCWIRVMVKCQILTKGLGLPLVDYGEAWVTSVVKVKCRIQTPGLGLELDRH
ncbi:Nuclear Rna Export Factor 1 [Manis pentadactyla]|nr:Nuclear Rna Export Factor 1 [Manis pentadactyla]